MRLVPPALVAVSESGPLALVSVTTQPIVTRGYPRQVMKSGGLGALVRNDTAPPFGQAGAHAERQCGAVGGAKGHELRVWPPPPGRPLEQCSRALHAGPVRM